MSQLLSHTRETSEIDDWKAMHDLGKVLLQPGPLEQKLHDALSIVCRFHESDRSVISVFNTQTGKLDVRASRGMAAKALVGLDGVTPGQGACGRAYAEQTRFVVRQFDKEPCLAVLLPWANEFSIQAVYSTPFYDSTKNVSGVLSLYFDAPHQPSEREMQLTDACAGTIALFLDRARIEEAAAQNALRYTMLAQTLSAIVWRYDPSSDRFFDVHGWEAFTGLLVSQNTGRAWRRALHPGDREMVAQAWIAAAETVSPYRCVHRLVHHDGSYHHVRTTATPIVDSSGNVIDWVGNCEDVTAEHTAREMLADANRRKDGFLAVLGHELRNPLGAVKTAATLLAKPEIPPSRIAHIGQVIDRQVGHMSRLVEDLLDVSRIEQGLIVLDKTPVDLVEIATVAIEQVTSMVEAKHHTLEVSVSAGPYLVEGDRTRLIQVVANLLSNATRYTPDHGRITLSIAIVGKTCRLTVSDNGVGIDPEIAPTLFDLYVQAERSADRSGSGLGLGLALVKSLVELHQGTVSVHSDGKLLGSAFEVRLPSLALTKGITASYPEIKTIG